MVFTQVIIETKVQTYWQADNLKTNRRNLLMSNPKSGLHNINANTKFGENPLIFTQVDTHMDRHIGPNVKP